MLQSELDNICDAFIAGEIDLGIMQLDSALRNCFREYMNENINEFTELVGYHESEVELGEVVFERLGDLNSSFKTAWLLLRSLRSNYAKTKQAAQYVQVSWRLLIEFLPIFEYHGLAVRAASFWRSARDGCQYATPVAADNQYSKWASAPEELVRNYEGTMVPRWSKPPTPLPPEAARSIGLTTSQARVSFDDEDIPAAMMHMEESVVTAMKAGIASLGCKTQLARPRIPVLYRPDDSVVVVGEGRHRSPRIETPIRRSAYHETLDEYRQFPFVATEDSDLVWDFLRWCHSWRGFREHAGKRQPGVIVSANMLVMAFGELLKYIARMGLRDVMVNAGELPAGPAMVPKFPVTQAEYRELCDATTRYRRDETTWCVVPHAGRRTLIPAFFGLNDSCFQQVRTEPREGWAWTRISKMWICGVYLDRGHVSIEWHAPDTGDVAAGWTARILVDGRLVGRTKRLKSPRSVLSVLERVEQLIEHQKTLSNRQDHPDKV